MARASTPTKLPLDTWARIMGIDPLHFNQVQFGDQAQATCGSAWFQHEWQDHERVGREAVAWAIREAEDEIENALGYRLVPSYEADERVAFPRPYRRDHFNVSATDVRGKPLALQARWGHFVAGGTLDKIEVEYGAVVTYDDADGDGYHEVATVTVDLGAPGYSGCDVRVYYPDKEAASIWEIRPTTVVVSGNSATITWRREQSVHDELQEQYPVSAELRATAVDGADDNNFIDTVDVVRLQHNPAQQATLMWEPTGECGCSADSCALCAYETQTACLTPRGDPRHSFIAPTPATYDEDAGTFTSEPFALGRAPDIARLWYKAGLQDPRSECSERDMPREWERVVAYYAAAILPRSVCECRNIQATVARWQQDLAFIGGAEQLSEFTVREADLNNPFGSKAGQLYAWKRVAQRQRNGALGRAILA